MEKVGPSHPIRALGIGGEHQSRFKHVLLDGLVTAANLACKPVVATIAMFEPNEQNFNFVDGEGNKREQESNGHYEHPFAQDQVCFVVVRNFRLASFGGFVQTIVHNPLAVAEFKVEPVRQQKSRSPVDRGEVVIVISGGMEHIRDNTE